MTHRPKGHAKTPHEASPVNQEQAQRAVNDSHHEAERWKCEAEQAKEQYLRTLAEFENTKKRLFREKDEFVKYASETMARELLPIIDALDQEMVSVDKQADPDAIAKGVHLIYRQLLGLLAKEGIQRIPTIGQPFDPHLHEAVAQVETADGMEGSVLEEVQVGYTMHDRVIRPAVVKVSKRSSQTSDTRPQTSENPSSSDV